jgi:hypothetical protein
LGLLANVYLFVLFLMFNPNVSVNVFVERRRPRCPRLTTSLRTICINNSNDIEQFVFVHWYFNVIFACQCASLLPVQESQEDSEDYTEKKLQEALGYIGTSNSKSVLIVL